MEMINLMWVHRCSFGTILCKNLFVERSGDLINPISLGLKEQFCLPDKNVNLFMYKIETHIHKTRNIETREAVNKKQFANNSKDKHFRNVCLLQGGNTKLRV